MRIKMLKSVFDGASVHLCYSIYIIVGMSVTNVDANSSSFENKRGCRTSLDRCMFLLVLLLR